jgi:hypothetical protein
MILPQNLCIQSFVSYAFGPKGWAVCRSNLPPCSATLVCFRQPNAKRKGTLTTKLEVLDHLQVYDTVYMYMYTCTRIWMRYKYTRKRVRTPCNDGLVSFRWLRSYDCVSHRPR